MATTWVSLRPPNPFTCAMPRLLTPTTATRKTSLGAALRPVPSSAARAVLLAAAAAAAARRESSRNRRREIRDMTAPLWGGWVDYLNGSSPGHDHRKVHR